MMPRPSGTLARTLGAACALLATTLGPRTHAAFVGNLGAGMTDHTTPPAEAPRRAGPTAEQIGGRLEAALLREAALAKEAWRPVLSYLADLHRRSVLPARAHLPYPYETMGPGYQDGSVFGHMDLTHERLDEVRADPEHVRNQIRNELAGQQADGLIPGIVLFKGEDTASWKTFKANPPLWVFAVDAYFEQTHDTAVLRDALTALRRQIGWFEAHRRLPNGGFYYLDQSEKTWESGIDEGIRYDVRPSHPAAAVDACSHLYLVYDHAETWSRQLGEPDGEWKKKAGALRRFIRLELWDPETGYFYDHWHLHDPANRDLAFEGMWPVVVGAATPEQARRVIDEHLLNPNEFFTEHPIATVAVSDRKFELRMWRGPTWNGMTYWAARGCVRYGRPDAAHRLLEGALDATATEFSRTGTIWEFYHPRLGPQSELKRKESGRNEPCRDYVGHNPLFAMADLWRQTAEAKQP